MLLLTVHKKRFMQWGIKILSIVCSSIVCYNWYWQIPYIENIPYLFVPPHSMLIKICVSPHTHLNREKIPLTCCGIKAYDIKDPQMKCCAGRLYNLTSIGKLGHDEQCCGSILHNSSVGFIDNNDNNNSIAHWLLCLRQFQIYIHDLKCILK